jgi:AcrR family transcriptional regulator
MSRGPLIRAQVSSAIIDAAASIFAEHGDTASMADVASAAGVGRATLYRYFGCREELLRAIAVAAIADLEGRLAEAGLDRIAVPLAIERMARAIVATGIKFPVLIGASGLVDKVELERRVGDPMRAVFRRGVADGTLRSDLSVDLLTSMWGGLLRGVFRSPSTLEGGIERTSAALTSFFLDGAATR